MNQTAILVSPAPVDGYPPVQYQARLLADAGYSVELLTQPLAHAAAVTFRYPGVKVTDLAPRSASGPLRRVGNAFQFIRYLAALSAIRSRSRPVAVEIAFDPNGILMSDWSLFRPRRRVAHLHETLQRLDDFLEGRLKRAFSHYQRIVVADEGRARLLAEQLGLGEPPVVVPNVPLAESYESGAPSADQPFQVIYGGSLGEQQQIPLIIRSVALWPKDAVLVLVGDDTKPIAQRMKALAAELGLADRVRFDGWMNLDTLIGRYRRAHLGISLLSTEYDQWVLSAGASNKRYQYMQASLAQIGDRMPGIPELLEGNGIGRCIADYSEQAIADIVHHYVSHPDDRIEAGRKAERLHLERYNYQIAFEPSLRWISEGAGA